MDIKQSVVTESNEAMSPKEGAVEGADVRSEVDEAVAEEAAEQKRDNIVSNQVESKNNDLGRVESTVPIGSKALLEPYRKIIA